jgi:hypothetical protein
VGVEKLFPAKSAKTKVRQDDLQAIFSDRKTFSIPRNLPVWDGTRVFQQPRDLTPTLPASQM